MKVIATDGVFSMDGNVAPLKLVSTHLVHISTPRMLRCNFGTVPVF